ncbi:hypothetical protein RIF29_05599 [Crotalaria pallida]|uniref:Pyruvate carboxyltransferase domain-containing protein n=1 Tax=Crotalaria pallida TaxID=3830 RepID=A0AAN9J3Q0_CROPI
MLVTVMSPVVPTEKLAVHFHDTYGQSLANILISLQVSHHSIALSTWGYSLVDDGKNFYVIFCLVPFIFGQDFSDPRDADDARYHLDGRDFDGSRIIVEFAKGAFSYGSPVGLLKPG